MFSSSFLNKNPKENFRYIFKAIVIFYFSETPFPTFRTKMIPNSGGTLNLSGGRDCFVLLALPAFPPSVIYAFFTQNKGGGGGWVGYPGLSPRSTTSLSYNLYLFCLLI